MNSIASKPGLSDRSRRVNSFRCFRFPFLSESCKTVIAISFRQLGPVANLDHSLQRGQVRRNSGGLPSNKRSQNTGTTLNDGQKRTNVQRGLSLPSYPGQHLTFAATMPLTPQRLASFWY